MIGEFYKNLRKECKPLFDRLKDNPPPWTKVHTSLVQEIKKHVKELPCLGISNPSAFKIVETYASNVGFGGILKQKLTPSSPEQIVSFYSGAWNDTQINYSTIKKEILSLILCINKFQNDLLNQKFLIRIDCRSAKFVLEKNVKNLASKQIFARWQALLSIFDFDIDYIKGNENSIPDFLTRELPALVDSGADLNCIQEGLVPTTYYEKTNERLSSANGSQMNSYILLDET